MSGGREEVGRDIEIDGNFLCNFFHFHYVLCREDKLTVDVPVVVDKVLHN